MKSLRIKLAAVTMMIASLPSLAASGKDAESVVREYAATWNAGNLDAFLALHSPDVRKYRRDNATSQFELTTSGSAVVRQKYQPLFAKDSRVHVEIVSLTTLGEMVVSRDRVSGGADGHISHEMTMYQVRDGLIQSIWYLGREIE